MAVLDRSELEASPLADLHAIADQIGLEGFRRLRKADLIDAILGEERPAGASAPDAEDGEGEARPRRRRSLRPRRASSAARGGSEETEAVTPESEEAPASERPASERGGNRRGRGRARAGSGAESADEASAGAEAPGEGGGRIATGVVEVLGNGSAFLRVEPPEPSDQDVYISAAQVRRCELATGDNVSGPVRTPRRSERYPSLVRVDTINGVSADAVSDGGRYDDLPVAYPSERLTFGSSDPTLEAIEWLTPLGRGSRAVLVGPRGAGKSETLRRLFDALHSREDLEVSVVLSGARPEEIAQWREGPVAPAAALSFAASADSQDQAVERAIDAAKRVASRGGNALVLIDSLDGLHPHAARKALAAARNLLDGGSLTVVAVAERPFGGETSVIALESTGRQPVLDLLASGTLKAELLVGEDGAEAIAKARATAREEASA